MYNAFSQELHEDKLINEMIVGGSGGITFLNSSFMDDGQAVDIVAEYSIRLPFSEFGIPTLHFVQRARMHGWTGYVENSGNEAGREDDSVYVTDSGSVYHDKRDCIYLNPSVSAVDGSAVGSMRSTDGSIYYPCELCGASASLTAADTVYLTKSGNRFHTSKQCSGLKRTVFEIPLSEVGGRRPCSKCAAR